MFHNKVVVIQQAAHQGIGKCIAEEFKRTTLLSVSSTNSQMITLSAIWLKKKFCTALWKQ